MQTLATFTDINTSIKSTRTWFSTDTTPDSTKRFQRWSYSTRDNGDIGDKTPGQEDMREARRLSEKGDIDSEFVLCLGCDLSEDSLLDHCYTTLVMGGGIVLDAENI